MSRTIILNPVSGPPPPEALGTRLEGLKGVRVGLFSNNKPSTPIKRSNNQKLILGTAKDKAKSLPECRRISLPACPLLKRKAKKGACSAVWLQLQAEQ